MLAPDIPRLYDDRFYDSKNKTSRLVGRQQPLWVFASGPIRILAMGLIAVTVLIGVCCSIPQAHGSGLLIADGGFGGVLEIKEQDVRVTINNGIAVTEINQVFLNTENRIVEALYTFPVPRGGSVSNFSMVINGKEMIGEVVEKERARKIYESYKQTKRDPGLLEQVDYKRFEMRVFPIPANAEQRIKVTYYQSLDFDHDWATYVYPLATSTKGLDEKTTGKFALTVDINSEIPITQFSSPSHGDQFVVANHDEKYARASLETTEGDLSKDVVISFQARRPRTGLDMIASKRPGEDGYYRMTLTAGDELADSAGGMDYVFVLDISGSMANKGKLGLSTEAASAFVGSLGQGDRCEVMTFNNVPSFNFGALREVDAVSKKQAKQFLNSQRARGGTALRPALEAAVRYKDPDRPLNVVVLSDGMTAQNEQRELLAAINSAPDGVRVFCIGVGNEINRPLLQQLAERAGGLAAFISQGDDFQRQADAFRRKLVHPVVTELAITIDGVQVYDNLPGELPNLFHGSPIRLAGRYKNSGDGTVTIRGNVQGQPFEQVVEMAFPAMDDNNPQIERMWAYSAVQSLMNQIRESGETTELKEEVVRLCEGYSIVSEYASFIVLENDQEYKRWKIERRNATRIQRDRQAQVKTREKLKQLRERSLRNMGPKEPNTNQASNNKTRSQDSAATPVSKSDGSREATREVSTRNQDLQLGPTPDQPTRSRQTDERRSGERRRGGSGGGAIDPISATICLGLGGAAAWRRRRKMQTAEKAREEA